MPKNTTNKKTNVDDKKSAGNMVNNILISTQMNENFQKKCVNCGGEHPVYASSCESCRQAKDIIVTKHRRNTPYHEVRKMVAESKIIADSQTVQQGKNLQ